MIFTSDLVVQAKRYVTDLLKDLANKWYFYHNLEHSLDVFQRSAYLAEKEWLNEELQEILQLAALFHDTWFIEQYDKNEPIGAEIADKWLTKMNFPEDKIDIIKRVILATIPDWTKPNDILEAIIKDADIDNLWRDDFYDKFENIYKELQAIKNTTTSFEEYAKNSANFVNAQEFYSITQRAERDEKFEENKKMISKFL